MPVIAALDLLVLLAITAAILIVFTKLKKSKTVGQFAHDVVDAPPESDDELIYKLDTTLDAAGQRAKQIIDENVAAQARAEKLNRYKQDYGG